MINRKARIPAFDAWCYGPDGSISLAENSAQHWVNFGPVSHASAAVQMIQDYCENLPTGEYVVETTCDTFPDVISLVTVAVVRTVKVVSFGGTDG